MPQVQEKEEKMLWRKLKGECQSCVHYDNAEICPEVACHDCPCNGDETSDYGCLCAGAEYGEDYGWCHNFVRDTGKRVC